VVVGSKRKTKSFVVCVGLAKPGAYVSVESVFEKLKGVFRLRVVAN
jgi:hypothetical protein